MAEKKFPLYLPFIMVLMVVLLCRQDFESKESELAAYILNNQETLTFMASSALDRGSDSVQLIDGVNGISCWSGTDGYVDFKYYSIGLGSALGTHYGFYYSPDDRPSAYGGSDVNLISGDNGWTWTDGEAYGFTKKIMDNWYYYETSF